MTLQARAGQRAALRQVRTGLALAASVMVAIGAVATSAPLARAAGAETRVPLPATQDEPYIVGATGSAFVREDYDSATEEDDFSVSTDGGATWSVLTAPGFGEAWPRHFAAGKVTYAVPGESGDSTLVQRYDFASQGHSTLLEVPGAVDAIGTERVFYSAPRFAEEEPAVEYWTQAFEAAAQPVKLDYHPVATDFATSALRYGGGSRVVAVTRDESAPSEALVEVLPVDGSRSFTFRIAGYQDLDVQGDTAVYTLRSSTYLKVCFRSLDSASASPKCATVATGTRLSASVEANQAWTLVSVWKADYESLGQFMVTMGSTISIKKAVRPAGAESFWLTTAGDLARPLASVVTTDGGYMGTYLATGKVEGLFDYPDTTARIEQLQLTGGGGLRPGQPAGEPALRLPAVVAVRGGRGDRRGHAAGPARVRAERFGCSDLADRPLRHVPARPGPACPAVALGGGGLPERALLPGLRGDEQRRVPGRRQEAGFGFLH